ncbi:MAG: DNA polymerase III subunit delta' [Alphaproteobacteria bacterium]|nr:DNA polymerase III subunit delta' [Alphaproteobacteria bacterium]
MLTPCENLVLFGHQEARESFLKSMHSPRFSHAWIISGPFGIGKATFAFHMARYLLSGRTDGNTVFSETDPLQRRMVAQSHGDLWTLASNEGKEIGVDAIRDLNVALNQTPAEGGWRVVIIDGADRMNRNAANALLKRLEEPPVKTVFFLLTTLPGRLLPTIRSRCQFLPLKPLNTDEVKEVLESQSLVMPDFLAVSEGSPGQILSLVEGEGAQLSADLQAVLKGGEAASFIRTYGGEEQSYGLIEDLMRHFVHDQLLEKVEGRDSFFAYQSLDNALKVREKIEGLFDQCRVAQLDRKATLTCVFASLRG